MHFDKALAVRPAQGQAIPPRPQKTLCMRCKQEIVPGQVNHINGGYDDVAKKTILQPCPLCSAQTAQRLASKKQTELLIQIFGDAAIPWRMRNFEFESYPERGDQRAKGQVQAFVERHLDGDMWSKRMLYMVGPTGGGKTGLAVSALKQVLHAGKKGLYVIVAELMMKLQSCFNRNSDIYEDDLLSAICRVEWLILDDLGVEKGSAYVMRSLYLIIQKRADLGLYTVITSNLTTTELEELWRPDAVAQGFHDGVRIVERLREYAEGCAVVGNLRA
jgi:DNA replication protein DnaC